MKRLLIALMPVLVAAPGVAATIAADSLVCEAEGEVQFVARQQYITDKSGTKAVASAKSYVEFYALKSQAAPMLNRTRTAAELEAERAQGSAEAYKRVVATCASSGAASLNAEVLERRPISGLARVRFKFNGQDATLWALTSAVAD